MPVSVVEKLGIVIRIGRCATTKDLERSIPGVLHAVHRAWMNAHGIALIDGKRLVTQGHESLAIGEMVKFFRFGMTV